MPARGTLMCHRWRPAAAMGVVLFTACSSSGRSGATSAVATASGTTSPGGSAGGSTGSATATGSTSGGTASCETSRATWQSFGFAAQTASFEVTFDATPLAAGLDTTIGLSAGAASAFTDLAAVVLFNTAGNIQARNGSAYAADTAIAYAPNVAYHFQLSVNVASHLYDVSVSTGSGAPTALATGYAFRTEQGSVASLGDWSIFDDTDSAGSAQVCNFAVDSAMTASSGGTTASGATGGSTTGSSTTGSSTTGSSTTTGGSGGVCPQGTALADGCPGAPAGTPQYPTLLNLQQVVMLNVIQGSGYTDGTYTWMAQGGGGSGATGTLTVAGGQLGGATGQSYTITNAGTGYTSDPTISVVGLAGGSGASVSASVYQATPHNAATPWNMPGVDYYVGVPTGTVLKDPTSAASLPSGVSYASSVVTVTGCGVTLDGFDFTLHATSVVVNVPSSASGCITTIQNSKFSATAPALQPIANLIGLGASGRFVFSANTYDGLAAIGDAAGSGYRVNDPIQGSGTITLQYNDFHNFDSKVIQLSGSSPVASFVERYNLYADFGSCSATGTSACSHGEAEYTYASLGTTVAFTGEFNTYVSHFHSGSGDLTALHAVQADTVEITGVTDDHNVVIAPGPQATCNADNQTAYVASAAVYDGQQGGGALTNVTFSSNYIDASGAFFPWYHATGTGVTHSGNVDMGTGGPCNCNTVAGDGSCD